MTADQVDSGVTNQLLSPDVPAVQPQPQPEPSILGLLPPVLQPPIDKDLDVSTMDPIKGLTQTQYGVSEPDTLPDSVSMAQNATLVPHQISIRGDTALEDNVTDWNCDTHVLIPLSQDPVTQAHQLGEPEDQAQSETGQWLNEPPPASVWGLITDTRPRTPEVILKNPEEEASDSPNELWLDACQYLAGEEDERAILDDWSHSPEVGGCWPSYSPDNTKVSDFPWGADTVIGQAGGDSDPLRPHVERWSSVDSWASALSDWLDDVPDDFTATFKQTLTSTQGHPELPMAIQDQVVEPRPNQDSPVFTGQNCFSTSSELPEAAQLQSRDREENQTVETKRNTPSTKGDKEPGENQATQDDSLACPTDTRSFLGSLGGTSEQYLLDMAAPPYGATKGSYEAGMETDIDVQNKDDALLSAIAKDSESQYTFLEGEYSFVKVDKTEYRDTAGKVTENDGVLQLGSLVVERGEKSYGSAVTLSHYPSREAKAPNVECECVCGREPAQSTELHIPTHTLRNTRVPAGTQGQDTHVPAHVSSNTRCLQGEHQEVQWGGPQFIIPLAPISLGSTLFQRTNSALEADQAYARSPLNGCTGHSGACIQPNELWSDFGGVEKPRLDNYEEKLLINNKDNTSFIQNSPLGEYRGQLTQEFSELSRELSNLVFLTSDNLVVSEEDHIARVTLDLQDSLTSRQTALKPTQPNNKHCVGDQRKGSKMPHKTAKNPSEFKTHFKKDTSASLHPPPQASKQQENKIIGSHQPTPQLASKKQENVPQGGHEDQKDKSVTVIETTVITEKVTKAHGKKKKKHSQNAVVKSEAPPLVEVENGAKQKTVKGKSDLFEAKLGVKTGKNKDKPTILACQKDNAHKDIAQRLPQQTAVKTVTEAVTKQAASAGEHVCSVVPKGLQNTTSAQLSDDVIKRRRISEDKFGKHAVESQGSVRLKRDEAKVPETPRKKAYSEVVKLKTPTTVEVPRVVQAIQAGPVSEDPQSLCLWCQFSAVFTDHTVTWTREGVVLAEVKRSAGDESRVSFVLSKASNKDLGKYQCNLSSPHGSVSLEYLLTYEVLSEIVIPAQKNIPDAPAEVVGEEEKVKCSKLLFHEDFLSKQYFGENQSASIVTEKVHFGEGMHRRAFRTKMQAGMVSVFTPGHPCVLKVHNAISYGTKNNEELVQKNFNLAVEECHVQNTAREYIKAYTVVAQSNETFGDVPEIIPIYLVHRPSNDIPYATLEEELLGDFVKYSVRDGKEINLMRRDSEAGQKCCAFQHWVYHKTDGNLLVTDMQGVGMRLTDVGIATCKKGYRGFRGNCATSFIDQFKVLHLCNKYCELLELRSLQPKRAVSGPKPKAQTAPKKKTFGPTVKGKS